MIHDLNFMMGLTVFGVVFYLFPMNVQNYNGSKSIFTDAVCRLLTAFMICNLVTMQTIFQAAFVPSPFKKRKIPVKNPVLYE